MKTKENEDMVRAEAFEKLVNAVSLIGLTLETAEYLSEHDPQALKSIDSALESIGTPVKTLRNRSRDWHFEDADRYLPNDGSAGSFQRLGNTFLTTRVDGICARSVEVYIEDHLQSPDGTWEMVFFPHGEPEPKGVPEDYMAMYDVEESDRKERREVAWYDAAETDRKERRISPMHLQELDALDARFGSKFARKRRWPFDTRKDSPRRGPTVADFDTMPPRSETIQATVTFADVFEGDDLSDINGQVLEYLDKVVRFKDLEAFDITDGRLLSTPKYPSSSFKPE